MLHIRSPDASAVGDVCECASSRVVRQVWRSDTGQCVYEEAAPEGAGVGGQATLLQLAGVGGQTLMTATTDCRLRFHASQARPLPATSLKDLCPGTLGHCQRCQNLTETFALNIRASSHLDACRLEIFVSLASCPSSLDADHRLSTGIAAAMRSEQSPSF